jgi:hypothetical protein
MSKHTAFVMLFLGVAVCADVACLMGRDTPPSGDASPPDASRVDGAVSGDGPSGDQAASSCLVLASSYSHSCDADTDCVAAGFGDICEDPCISCPFAATAMNSSGVARYSAAVIAAWPHGTACACGSGAGGSGYEGSAAYCSDGQCVGGLRAGGDP